MNSSTNVKRVSILPDVTAFLIKSLHMTVTLLERLVALTKRVTLFLSGNTTTSIYQISLVVDCCSWHAVYSLQSLDEKLVDQLNR